MMMESKGQKRLFSRLLRIGFFIMALLMMYGFFGFRAIADDGMKVVTYNGFHYSMPLKSWGVTSAMYRKYSSGVHNVWKDGQYLTVPMSKI